MVNIHRAEHYTNYDLIRCKIKTRNTSRGARDGQQLQAGPAKENCASGQRYGILCLKSTFETIQQKHKILNPLPKTKCLSKATEENEYCAKRKKCKLTLYS